MPGKITDAPKRVIMADPKTAIIDAFGRQRVSNPTGLFDSQLQYDNSPLLWFEKETGGGGAAIAHLPNESSVRLRLSGATESLTRQTKSYIRYQPGKSQQIMMTFGPTTGTDGVTRRIGYFDDDNGIYFETTSEGAFLVKRSKVSGSIVNTRVAQADWNIDDLQGRGPSEVTLDISKVQILFIDLEWLGVGRVRVGFVAGGGINYVHEFKHANINTTTYMTTANLPLRYEITADGTATGNNDLVQICAGVFSEGGFDLQSGIPFSVSNEETTISVSSSIIPILSIRPKGTFNSIVNRTTILPRGFNIYAEDVATHYQVIYGGTLTGPSFADVNATYSGVEADVAASAITGGIVIDEGYVPAASIGTNSDPATELKRFARTLPLALDIAGAHPTIANAGASDVLTIAAQSVTGSASDTAVAIEWEELR